MNHFNNVYFFSQMWQIFWKTISHTWSRRTGVIKRYYDDELSRGTGAVKIGYKEAICMMFLYDIFSRGVLRGVAMGLNPTPLNKKRLWFPRGFQTSTGAKERKEKMKSPRQIPEYAPDMGRGGVNIKMKWVTSEWI